MSILTYGNGKKVKYLYDVLDRVSEIQYNVGTDGAFETAYRYTYDTAGNLFSVEDVLSEENTVFRYSPSGKLQSFYVYDAETYRNLYSSRVSYDDQDRVTLVENRFDYAVGSGFAQERLSYSYRYSDSTGYLERMTARSSNLVGVIDTDYDVFGRLSTRSVAFTLYGETAFEIKYGYSYLAQGNSQSALVSHYQSYVGSSTAASQDLSYVYDDNGNITEIKNASGVVQYKYTYDDLSQLIREDNKPLGYSYTYTYDNAGNILSKKRYAFTTGALGTANLTYNYSYDDATWGDLLTSFSGNYIAYDEIGNPIKIGNYDEAMDIWWYGTELTWDGRELVSYRSFEYYDEDYTAYGTPITFTYNADGIRTSKTVNGVEHLYYLNGSQITAETWTSGGVEYMLMYVYDETGSPIAIKYRTSSYAQNTFDVFFFEKNLQGDIVAIYNSSGTKIGTYTYDAWGNFTVTTNSSVSLERLIVSTYNPFRYRGYYYDTDTSLYYLESRYYNAQWGRFLNGDSALYSNLLGFNQFIYCYNNPINYIDYYGENTEKVAWATSMWWLILVDGPIPVGDILYVVGAVVVAGILVEAGNEVEEELVGIVLEKSNSEDDTEADKNNLDESPESPKDKRLSGKPGDINKEGYKETKIGKDGRAIGERHHTDHGSPKHHSNPHDHDITWTPEGKPKFGPAQNYWGEKIPIFK